MTSRQNLFNESQIASAAAQRVSPPIEVERYELNSPPLHHFEIKRRDFVKIFGAGIAVFLVAKDALAQQQGESGGGRRGGFSGEQMPKEISAWLHVDENGAITVCTGKVEMGQNIRTSLAQAVAEELRAPFHSITLIMGDTQLTPYDAGTFGSRSTPQMGTQLRHVASAACDILVDIAAKQWNLERSRLVAKNGEVTDPATRRSLKYGELAKGQALARAIPDTDPLVPVAEWIVSGKSIPKVDGTEFVTGGHKYTSDVKLPGMMYGKVLRPPSFGATLASVDVSAAQAIPGVQCVRDGDFIGVAAPDTPTATEAIAAIRAEWKETPTTVTSANVYEYLKANPQKTEGRGEGGGQQRPSGTGDVEQGLAAAAHKLDATYTVAYIAHAPLEPRAAVAQWEGGKLTVHTGSQRPFGVRDELINAFHLDEASVRVLIPDTGSAYGGKHTGEFAVEAARIAKAAGKPVKLVWTREEEFTWAYFRPAGVMEISSGVDADGKLTAWEFHNYNSGGSALNSPYAVANKHEQFHPTQYPLRQGSYRALAATANMFARESHMDDLARAAGIDPLEFRLSNLPDDDSGKRIRDVLLAATKSFGWDARKKNKAAGIGYGLACGTEKNGFIATCAEINADRATGAVKVTRVVTAFDCGAVVNPDGLRNQIAGSNVMGLGGALFEAIQFSNGKIENPKFSKYRVPRFKDVGIMEVVLVDRKDIPSAGAGETPLMALAPAIGNAICDATGVRLRSLPLIPNGLKW
jgi:nicotinate dehydrogenase subunit B